jgi:Ca2+-binding EF-hand superfamily protein
MKAMDEDGSGTIDRLEWIRYLACSDSESGDEKFDFNLKKLFDQFDIDKDGLINFEELKNLLYEKFAKEIMESPNSKQSVDDMIMT